MPKSSATTTNTWYCLKLRSWVQFRELLQEYPGIPRAAPRMAFLLQERLFQNWGGSQASDLPLLITSRAPKCVTPYGGRHLYCRAGSWRHNRHASASLFAVISAYSASQNRKSKIPVCCQFSFFSQFWEGLFAILVEFSQFCLRSFNRNSRGDPSLCWLGGGERGTKILNKYFVSLVTRIAATSNRKSLATAIATQKNHCDSENTSNTAISLRFLQEKLATSELWLAIASDLWLRWRGSLSLWVNSGLENQEYG